MQLQYGLIPVRVPAEMGEKAQIGRETPGLFGKLDYSKNVWYHYVAWLSSYLFAFLNFTFRRHLLDTRFYTSSCAFASILGFLEKNLYTCAEKMCRQLECHSL